MRIGYYNWTISLGIGIIEDIGAVVIKNAETCILEILIVDGGGKVLGT